LKGDAMKKRGWIFVGVVIFILGMSAFCSAEEGLVGYWKFDEGKGNIVRDSSGKSNDGKIYGAVYIKSEKGFALKFDGGSNYVDCGESAFDFTTNTNFTVEAWFKTSDTAYDNHRCIISKGASTCSGDKKGWYLHKLRGGIEGQENKISFRIMDGEGFKGGHSITLRGPAVADDIWHFAVTVVNRDSGIIYLYLDGVEVKNRAISSAVGTVDNDYHLLIGNDEAENMYWKGLIDEVKIYNRALSAGEIKKHYLQPKMD